MQISTSKKKVEWASKKSTQQINPLIRTKMKVHALPTPKRGCTLNRTFSEGASKRGCTLNFDSFQGAKGKAQQKSRQVRFSESKAQSHSESVESATKCSALSTLFCFRVKKMLKPDEFSKFLFSIGSKNSADYKLISFKAVLTKNFL